MEDSSFIGTRWTEDEIRASSFATSNTEIMLPTTLELASSESNDSTLLNVVGKDVFHVSQEQDTPCSTNEPGPEDGSVSSINQDEPLRAVISPGNALTGDSSRAMRHSGAEIMLSEDISEPSDDIRANVEGRSRVDLGSSHSLHVDTTLQESEIQLIPDSLMQKSNSVLTASLQTGESATIITETSHSSLELVEGKRESPLLSQCSSEHSCASSGGPKSDFDLPRDDKTSIELDTSQDSSEEFMSADEYFARKSLAAREVLSLPTVTGNENEKRRRPTRNLNRSSSIAAIGTEAEVESLFHPTAVQPFSQFQQVKSKKARGSVTEKKVAFKPTKRYSKFKQEALSDDSDDTTQEPGTSIPRKRFPLFGRKDKTSSPHSPLLRQRRDALLQVRTDVPPGRKSLQSPKPDTLELNVKDEAQGVELLPSGSFEDDSLPLQQRRIEDLGKSQSSYTKEQKVKSSKAQIPLKVKKAFKFLTSQKEHKLYSKFQQEGSSDDSEDTTLEPEASTPRKRFPLFGLKRKDSWSRGKTSRHDFLPQTESDVLSVPSTQQENAPVVADQSVIADYSPCSTELETGEVTGADTLTEGSIGVASDRGEKLENVSSGLSKSVESVIRGEDATIESKEIEEFEHEHNIDLSAECAEFPAPIIDSSASSFPEISCETEDIKGNEGDLQEQTLRSESVSRESVGERAEQIKAGSFIVSPGQDNFTSSTTPSLSQVIDVLRTVEETDKTDLEDGSGPSVHEGEHSRAFTLPSDNAVRTDSSSAMPRTVAKTMHSEDVSEPEANLGESTSGTFRVSAGSVHEEFQPSYPRERLSKAGITSTSPVPSGSGMTNLSLHSSQSCQQEKLPKDIKSERALQAELSSCSSGASIRSSGRSTKDATQLRQAKPYTVSSDSDISLCGESTSSTLAFTTSSASHHSPSRSSTLSKLPPDIKSERTPQAKLSSCSSDTPIRSSGCSGKDATPLRQAKPLVVLSESDIPLCGESTSSTLAFTASSELSSPRVTRQEISQAGTGMLVSGVNNLLVRGERPHDDDTSSKTDK